MVKYECTKCKKTQSKDPCIYCGGEVKKAEKWSRNEDR